MYRIFFYLALLFGFTYSCTAPDNASATATEPADLPISNECIAQIIEQDSRLGNIRNHASEKVPLSQAILDYVTALEALNYLGCPDSFVIAFAEHRRAWVALTLTTDFHPGIRGEMHELFAVIESGEHGAAFQADLQNIRDTWQAVEVATGQRQ